MIHLLFNNLFVWWITGFLSLMPAFLWLNRKSDNRLSRSEFALIILLSFMGPFMTASVGLLLICYMINKVIEFRLFKKDRK